MTATIPPITGYVDDPFVEEPVSCSLLLTPVAGKEQGNFPCPNNAIYDAFVTCANGHDRTQCYCNRCHVAACAGNVDCRECKLNGAETKTCPVIVLASFPRGINNAETT